MAKDYHSNASRKTSEKYRNGYDRIFKNKVIKPVKGKLKKSN